MNAADVVGYIVDGAFYCAECGSDGMDAVFASSEWDSFPTCDSCTETCFDVSLTSEGFAYELEQIGTLLLRRTPEALDIAESIADALRWRGVNVRINRDARAFRPIP